MTKNQKNFFGLKAHIWVVSVYDLVKARRTLLERVHRSKKAAHEMVKNIGRSNFVGPLYHKVSFEI